MKLLTTTIARIIFAIPFAVFGLLHLTNADKMAGYVPVPGGAFWVYLTGVAMIAAAASIITGKWTKVACLSLAGLLLVIIVTMQIPGLFNPQMAQMAMSGLLKDTSLMGGALLIAGMYDKKSEVANIY
jgi:putative oxidoreductase